MKKKQKNSLSSNKYGEYRLKSGSQGMNGRTCGEQTEPPSQAKQNCQRESYDHFISVRLPEILGLCNFFFVLDDGCEYDNEHDPVKYMKQDERSDESKIERPLCSSATVIRYHTVKH